PGRADGADEERRLDSSSADRALAAARRQPLLDRADLQVALAHLVEVFGRPEEHVDQRADERQQQRDDRREGHQPLVGDAAPRVLVRPEPDCEPEHDADRDQPGAGERPGAGGEEVGERERQGGRRHYNSSLPIMYPAVNVSPTKATRTTRAKKKTLRRGPRWTTGPRAGTAIRSPAPALPARGPGRGPRAGP